MKPKFSFEDKMNVFFKFFLSKKIFHISCFGGSLLLFLQVLMGSKTMDWPIFLFIKILFSLFLSVYILFWWRFFAKVVTGNNRFFRYILSFFIIFRILQTILFLCVPFLSINLPFFSLIKENYAIFVNQAVMDGFLKFFKEILVFYLAGSLCIKKPLNFIFLNGAIWGTFFFLDPLITKHENIILSKYYKTETLIIEKTLNGHKI